MKKRIGVLSAVLYAVIMLLASCGSRFEDYRILTTLSNNTDWGTVTTTGLNGSGGASPNSKIVITAVPKTGYYADHCTCSEIPDLAIVKTDTENVWELTMPDKDITVTVYFKAIEVEPEPEPEPEAPKLVVSDGNSSNGVKLKFENIPEGAKRRYIYLGTGDDKAQIDCKAEWSDPDQVKDTTYFYPFTAKGNKYDFTVCYESYTEQIASATVSVTAQGGIGDFECTNREKTKFVVDKNGNLTWKVKPTVIENITSEKQIAYGIQAWDAVSDWVDPSTAWLSEDEGYFWIGKWDHKDAGEKVEYNNFNVIDQICTQNTDKPNDNIKQIDTLVKNKGVLVYANYDIKNPLAEDEWYYFGLYEDQYFTKGKEGKGVFVLEPSPLLGTWMGKAKAYTFYQDKVVVEDASSTHEYSYSYTGTTVTINGVTYEYGVNETRTRLTIVEDDDTTKTYTRTVFGKKLEVGYDSAEVKIENNKLKFVTSPGAKTYPAGVTSYRVDFCTEPEGDNDTYGFIACASFDSLTFDDIDIDSYVWDKEIRNKKLVAHVLWGQNGWDPIAETSKTNYEVADSWKKAEVKVENNVLKFVKNPGANTIPEGITSYRVDLRTEAADGKVEQWLHCVKVNSLTFNDINLDDYLWDKEIKNKKINAIVVWGQDGWNVMCDSGVVTNYEVSSGYELPVTTIEGTVVSMTKPGNKLLALYPETDHYTVFIHKEANKYENWLALKEFALSDNITFDLYELNINPSDIIDGKVNICLELKKSDENMLKRLTDNNWVDFDGYKYHFTLSDNLIGMNDGISFRISEVPEEAKIRDVGVRIDGNWYEINWSETATEVQSTTLTYPFVVPNTEYEVGVNYYIRNEDGSQGKKIATSTFKTTPKGGSGSIIAVNAPDIKGKIEGQTFSWVVKPKITGTHTKGKMTVNFFKPNTSHWLGSYSKSYADICDLSYTGFNLADAFWNDEGKEFIKNATAIGVIYHYDADDGSGDYDGLPCTVNQKSQDFTDLSISINLTSGE